MRNLRLISRLDIKAPNLVKGIQLEGLRKLGNPNVFAKKYYEQGIDEIIYIDIVASLYERNSLLDIIEETTKNVFVPITVGGGLRSVGDVEKALRAGADKVAINTAAIKRPELITEIANQFGSQCIVLSIEAKKQTQSWEAFYDNGREHSNIDAIEWAIRGEKLGAGEILLTSVDQEGTGKGFDLNLIEKVTKNVNIPVISSGGMGNLDHLNQAVLEAKTDAVAMANVLHYNKLELSQIRNHCINNDIQVRNL
jgi:imidazole glycerol-phosphate synthase subunit HisF